MFFTDPSHQPFKLGSGSAGALLIHGFPGTPAELRPLGEQLAAADYTAYGLLLPGFGAEIETLITKTSDDWLRAAQKKWSQIQQDHHTTTLIGYSMGGAIATCLAAQQPPDHLVLLAPFWRLNTILRHLLPIVKYIKPRITPFEKANFDDPELRKQMHSVMGGDLDLDNPEIQQQLRKNIVIATATFDEVRRLGQAAYKAAARLTCPTLIIQGAQDDTVVPSLTRRFMQQINGRVSYHEINGTHAFPKQQTDFVEIIL
ncbi:MAG: alpha/beta fold hydrolase, partial [Anaerolineales bacterium]|nr:alpha/beta fold hydrolase [Anaerolineales bacterium]